MHMNSRTLTVFGIAALLTIGAAPVVAAQTTQPPASKVAVSKPTDKSLSDRINKRLDADVSLKKYTVDAAVDTGVATLTGTVATATQRARAGTLAHVTGITKVDNKIVVDKNAPTTMTEKAKETLSKTGEVITDAWITTKVKAQFIGVDALKDSNINVDTADHVVTLKGTVMTAAGRAKAIEIAKGTEGVTRVVDTLKIGPADPNAADKVKSSANTAADKTKSAANTAADKTKEGVSKTGEVITDAWITTKVKSQFIGVDDLKDSDINVDTANHVVTLKGRVLTAAGRAKAVDIAKKTDGVTKVNDQLTIGPKR
jgi:osmotically-inducible protein OsmY